jgi:hypothetical protein
VFRGYEVGKARPPRREFLRAREQATVLWFMKNVVAPAHEEQIACVTGMIATVPLTIYFG